MDQLSSESPPEGARRLTFPIVAVGASAGGLPALTALFASLPASLNAALVIVTHTAPESKSRLAEALAGVSRLPVREVADGDRPTSGTVHVLPSGHDLVLTGGIFGLVERQAAPVNRPIDRFMASLARDQGPGVVGIILSGTGSDGSLGLREIHATGGLILAQQPETALHGGMPSSAIHTGLVDVVLPVEEMGPYLAKILPDFCRGRGDGPIDVDRPENRAAFERILALLLEHTGHDLSGYKPSTLLRRIHKRLLLAGMADLSCYAALLADSAEERSRLFADLLIGVTAFFRDTGAFSLLAEVALPAIFESLGPGEVMRTWVACCSTGEEAYSVAVLLAEHCRTSGSARPLKIFATDIDPFALDVARRGVYPVRLADAMGKDRLREWFHCNTESCSVSSALREDIIFAVHDILRDPPFLGMDLIVCRNFLIYLNADIQAKVVSLFSHALRPGGYLLLGPAETLGQGAALFETVDKKWRLFRRKATAAGVFSLPSRAAPSLPPKPAPPQHRSVVGVPDPEGVAEGFLLSRYGHPAALLDLDGQVVRLVGDTKPYLELGAGAPSLSVRKLARKALRPFLRRVVDAALATGTEQASIPAAVERTGSDMVVIRAIPVSDHRGNPAFLLVIFEKTEMRDGLHEATAEGVESRTDLVVRYETELERLNDDLQHSVEGYETLTEELKASNEELVSLNEELQSSNEEMDASREELQSLNEELTSLNADLQAKIEEAAAARGFVENLLAATNIATVVLDASLAVVRFTPAAEGLFHLAASDQGRLIGEIKTDFDAGFLVEDCRKVLAGGSIVEREFLAQGERWFLERGHPYRGPAGEVAGVVLTFTDVTMLKAAEAVLRRGKEELEELVARRTAQLQEKARLLDQANVMVRDMDGRVTFWTGGCERLFGWTRQEALGQAVSELLKTQYPQPYEDILASLQAEGSWSGELRKTAKDGRVIDLAVSWLLNRDAAGRPSSILEVDNDVTERKKAEDAMRDMARFPSENPNPVLRVGTDMTVQHANPASAVFLRASRSGVGRPFPEAHAPVVRQTFITGLTEHFEAEIGERPFLFAVCPVLSRGYANIYGMDMTERKQVEIELAKSEARLRQLVDSAPDAIMIQANGRFTYVNPAAVRLFGATSAQELLDEPIVEHMHPDCREIVRERIRIANEERIPLPNVELSYLRRDGTAIPVEAVAAPFEYQGGPASLVFARDITSRKQAAEERRRQIEMAEAVARIRECYLAGNPSAQVFDAALQELLRASGSRYGFIAELREDEHGTSFQQCLAISNIAWDEATRQFYSANAPSGLVFYAMDGLNAAAIVTGDPVIANHPDRDPRSSGRLPAGHPPLETFLGLPLFHGQECVGSIGLANRPGGYDAAMIATTAPLVDVCAQIIERMRAERRLVAAKQAAEAASLAKSEFLANMSHEIRTPLNGVLGMLQLMQTTTLDSEQGEYVENAVKSSKRLTRLLSDILDLSLVESGKLSIHDGPCRAADLREAVIDLFALPARDKGLALSVSIGSGLPESFVADEARLRQILFNLVGNAVKFTDRGLVSLDISPASIRYDTGFRVLLTVSDTGIGIPDAQICAIFEPFSQVEGVYARRFGGAGLGLSIVRRLVKLMGGEIAVESEEMRGTTIFVSLPLKRLASAATKPAPREDHPSGLIGLRLLLAEDDAISAMSFTRMLEKAGHHVDVAQDGKQALALLTSRDYDCILMDVQMPVMDGVQATQAIRTDAAFSEKARVPIIAMTAYAMAGDREKILAAGMDDYVGKPVDRAELERAIGRVLAAKSQIH